MSVDSELRRYPQGITFASEITIRPEFRKGHSRMRAFADFMYDNGRAGFPELYEAIKRARGFTPDDPLSIQIPQEFAPRIGLNGGAILWGALFRTVETLMVNRVYDPYEFSRLLNMGFSGCKWGDSVKIEPTSPIFFNHNEVDYLVKKAAADKTFSFLLEEGGLHHLPTRLQDDVVMTRFYRPMTDYFGPVYTPLAEMLVTSPLTPREIYDRTRGQNAVTSPNAPLTFR